MSCSNKGGSVSKEIRSVYGENLPVVSHIVYPAEQLPSFTPQWWWRLAQSSLRGLSDQTGHEPWLFRLTGDELPTCSGSRGRCRETASQIRMILKAILKFYFHKVCCRLQLCHWLLVRNQSIMVFAREEFDKTSAVLKVVVCVSGSD